MTTKRRQNKRSGPAGKAPNQRKAESSSERLRSFVRQFHGAAGVLRRVVWGHPKLFEAIWALLISAPPALVTHYFSIEKFATSIRTNWPLVASMLEANPALSLTGGFFWTLGLIWARSILATALREGPPDWERAFALMVTEFDEVVGRKERRFGERLLLLKGGNGKNQEQSLPGSIFGAITQPRAQLDRLTQGVWQLFYSLLSASPRSKKTDLRANLSLVREGKVEQIVCHLPSNLGVRTSCDVLSRRESGIMTAVRTGRIVVIESTAEELRRPRPQFVIEGSVGDYEDASLICYPVRLVDPDMFFVVSLLYSKPRGFLRRYEHAYSELLESFALRMRLEYNLMALKGLSGVEDGDGGSR